MTALTASLPSPWEAVWISPIEEEPAAFDRPAYLLEREFQVATLPAQATLHATALGVYEAYLNGNRVGDIELAPGSSSYDETLYAQSYDVTQLLRAGGNRLEIVLSDGWYRGRNGATQRRNVWGDTTAALAQIEVPGSARPVVLVRTDSAWTCRRSAIVRADLMRGQRTDLSLPLATERPVLVGVVDPPEPTRSPAPPVRRVEVRRPVSATALSPDVTILDVGQNISGWVRLEDAGPEGAITTLTYAEHLDRSGDVTTEHLDVHSPLGEHAISHQVDEVVAGPEPAAFEPRHTIHGFRYVRVHHPGRRFGLQDATAVVVHTDLTRTGWFECDDERLNRLHTAADWTFRSNAVDVPTDCPTRERVAWTGDYQVFAPTAVLLYDVLGFSRKWLQSVRDDQYDNGSLAMFSPDAERMKIHVSNPQRIGGGSAGWGDAAVEVPWTLYRHYGDEGVLRENWQCMRDWVDFAHSCAREHRHPTRAQRSTEPLAHEQYIWDGPFHFGEWNEPKPISPPGTDTATAYEALLSADQGDVGTAFLYRSTWLLAEIADILGFSSDAAQYRDLADHVRDAWRTEFLDPDGHTTRDSQASYVRAIAFGLIPDDLIPAASGRLVQLIHESDDHLATGFLTTGTLLEVLADTGHLELAYRLLTQTGVPSWLEMLNRGGTTFWERWDAVDDEGNVTEGSLNHYAKGAAMRFLHTHVGGLRQDPESIGWQRVVLAPCPGGDITSASTRLETGRGPISVSWKLARNELTLTATVPEGVHATADLGGTERHALPTGTTTLAAAWPPAPSTNPRKHA